MGSARSVVPAPTQGNVIIARPDGRKTLAQLEQTQPSFKMRTFVKSGLQELLFQVHPCHRPPPRPVVIALVAPDMKFVPNATRAQDCGKLLVLLPAHVPFASREHRPHVV